MEEALLTMEKAWDLKVEDLVESWFYSTVETLSIFQGLDFLSYKIGLMITLFSLFQKITGRNR